ncbi:hypothetical protein ACHWQZ_G015261 [Mnemiopsis leidyi]
MFLISAQRSWTHYDLASQFEGDHIAGSVTVFVERLVVARNGGKSLPVHFDHCDHNGTTCGGVKFRFVTFHVDNNSHFTTYMLNTTPQLKITLNAVWKNLLSS